VVLTVPRMADIQTRLSVSAKQTPLPKNSLADMVGKHSERSRAALRRKRTLL